MSEKQNILTQAISRSAGIPTDTDVPTQLQADPDKFVEATNTLRALLAAANQQLRDQIDCNGTLHTELAAKHAEIERFKNFACDECEKMRNAELAATQQQLAEATQIVNNFVEIGTKPEKVKWLALHDLHTHAKWWVSEREGKPQSKGDLASLAQPDSEKCACGKDAGPTGLCDDCFLSRDSSGGSLTRPDSEKGGDE